MGVVYLSKAHWRGIRFFLLCLIWGIAVTIKPAAHDLPEIKANGVLRHLGVPYANFVGSAGDGFDLELVKLFAKSLDLKYDFVQSTWDNILGDLTGEKVTAESNEVRFIAKTEIKGDIVASGITIQEWRRYAVLFSKPTFPTQVWLIAPAESELQPIVPTGNLESDIILTKKLMRDRTLLCKKNTSLDPNLHQIAETGAKWKLFTGSLNEIAPALMNGESELTLLDVPDTLIALQKWSGKIKVLGPVSPNQTMAAVFAKDAPLLREAFDRFLENIIRNGTYKRLVEKYYPFVFDFYTEFYAFSK